MENKEIIKKRIENQLRVHWNWLKDENHEEVSKFIDAIIDCHSLKTS